MENTAEVKTTDKKETVKKVLSIVGNVLFYIFILLLLLFAIANLAGNKKNVPSLFGRYYISVLSDSMDGIKKDSFKEGDMIIDKIATNESIEKLQIGDIVTFTDPTVPETASNQFNTHRIVDIIYREDGLISEIILQGDLIEKNYPDMVYTKEKYAANYNNMKTDRNYTQSIVPSQVEGIYVGKIRGLGGAIVFLRTQTGFGLCIVLPTAVLLLLEGFFLVRNLLLYSKQKMAIQQEAIQEQQKADLEAERERMKAELLAQLKQEQSESKEEATEDKQE